MYKNIKVDKDLFYLECILFDLENYRFDEDIASLILKLKSLVETKIFNNLDFEEYGNMDKNIILTFFKK